MKEAVTIALAGAAVAAGLSFVAPGVKTETPAVVSEAKAAESTDASGPIVVAQTTASVLNYERGPRIIIVPQSDSYRGSSRASVERDEDDIAPPPRRVVPPPVRTTPRWAPQRVAAPSVEKPRAEKPYVAPVPRRVETAPVKVDPRVEEQPEPRPEKRVVRHIDMSKPKPKTDATPDDEAPSPQPLSPRRAVLSAPPLPADGPSPVKPTPKFGSSVDAHAESTAPSNEPSSEPGETPPPSEVTADQPPLGYTPPAAATNTR